MTTPRIEIDLEKIRHNTQHLVGLLKPRGISVTAVTKAVCGDPAIANAMLDAGAAGLAESRIGSVERLRNAGITCPITMIRTPILSQVSQIVLSCGASYNTEISVIAGLAAAVTKARTIHDIILMVEMGDMREGIYPGDLLAIAQQVVRMPGVALKGIGANFACFSNMAPEAATLAELSSLAIEVEDACDISIEKVSGGNSSNLLWALGENHTGRINNLRVGEAILLGVDPVTGDQIEGLHTDAFALFVEVIETKIKHEPLALDDTNMADSHPAPRAILAIGQQDTDIAGLTTPAWMRVVGATSDHCVIATSEPQLNVGDEVKFQMNYSALMRAMKGLDIVKVAQNIAPLPKR